MLDFDVRSPQGDAGKGVYKPLPDYLKKKKKKLIRVDLSLSQSIMMIEFRISV